MSFWLALGFMQPFLLQREIPREALTPSARWTQYSSSQREGHMCLSRPSPFLPGITFPDGGLGQPSCKGECAPCGHRWLLAKKGD